MWRSHVSSSQHSPPRIEPHLGQVSENSAKPPRSEHWGVFHEDESGSYLANHSRHLAPKPGALAVDSGALASAGDVLTGESSRDDVNISSPRSPVEGADVIPYGEAGEVSVSLAGEEDAAAVGIKLDSADGTVAEEEVCEDASTGSGE